MGDTATEPKAKRRWHQFHLWRLFLLTLIVALVCACAASYWAWHPLIEKYCRGVHQEGITLELAKWEKELAQISSHGDAVHAARNLRYIANYYVPGPGYRSTPEIETALEAQRQRTLTAVSEALDEFTGNDFGLDYDKWDKWLQEQGDSQLLEAPEPR